MSKPKVNPAPESKAVSARRAELAVMSRFDPLPYLTPERLVTAHAAYRKGYLSRAAVIWQDIISVDDKLVSVVPNRLNGPGRQRLRYVASSGQEKNPKAAKHIEALKYHYENLICTDALNRDIRGGYTHLFRSMMQARAFGYAAQEIVWRPSAKGLTATYIDIPLQFFEHITGRLRFLQNDFDVYGVDMDPRNWLVTATRDHLMMASAAARMFKIMPLKDWLVYCEKCAMPGLHGESNAAVNSPEWNEFKEALRSFGVDLTLLTQPGAKVNPIDISAKGELAYPGLVDRCDRALSAIWLGGDLGSMSRGGGETGGVMLQDKINDQDLTGDCRMLTGTLNEQIDRMVIQQVFGEEPLAYVVVDPPQPDTRKEDIETDRFLIDVGFPMTVEQLADRYDREVPEGHDAKALVKAPTQPFDGSGAPTEFRLAGAAPRGVPAPAFNELPGPDDPALGKLLAAARLQLDDAQAPALEQVAAPIQALIERARAGSLTPEQFAAEVDLLRMQLPEILAQMDAEPAAAVLEEVYAAALAIGLDDAKAQEEVPA